MRTTPQDTEFVSIRRADLLNTFNSTEVLRGDLEQLIESAPSLYVQKKRASYLLAFVEYIKCKAQKRKFVPPKLNALYFEEALDQILVLVQKRVYGKFIDRMREKTFESLDDIIKRCNIDASQQEKSRLKEIRALKRYRLCVDKKGALRIEGQLYKSPYISFEAKHPLILPSRHFLTRIVILYYHNRNWHSGIQHTLLSSRQKFWITNGRASVRRCLRECSVCAIDKARPILSDLPPSRTSAYKKTFFHCGLDYFGPFIFIEGRSQRKAWGLLFTCMSSRVVHVELVTSLSLSEFVLAFNRFSDLRGPVSKIYSDNGTTFQAASKSLPSLLCTGLKTSLRKREIFWEFIPHYAGAWESMVKQIKRVIFQILDSSKRKLSSIELITYMGSAVRIVNERPLVPLGSLISDDAKDCTVITPASLLTPYASPYSIVGESRHKDNLRRDYRFNVSLSQKFWEKWLEFYLPWLQGRNKWHTVNTNLIPGQLVVLSSPEDIAKQGMYQLGRIHEVIPQMRNGKTLVKRAAVAILKKDENTG